MPKTNERVLSREEARRAYDRIGSFQDSQAFYEDRATDELIRHADFESSEAVFEFGCGTGRFAEKLLSKHLPDTATYRGVDVSTTMFALAQDRLAAFEPRAEVVLTEGQPTIDEPSGAYDRFVSNYVLDLLSTEDIETVLHEAHRMLRPGGLACFVSLTNGTGFASRTLMRAWGMLQSLRPSLVGGCRPIELLAFVKEPGWHVRHLSKVVSFAIPSEIVVAEAPLGLIANL